MRKFLFPVILILAGCGSLHEDYVRQDRANYETLAPRIRKMLTSTTEYDDAQKQDIEDRLQGWDAKSAAAVATFNKEGAE